MFTGSPTAAWRVVRVQAMLAPAAALIGGALAGVGAGLAALYGVVVALAVNAVLVWRERQSMAHPEWDQHRLFKLFLRVGVERLALLIGLLAVGLGVLGLAALPLLSGLLIAQFAWLAAASGQKNN